MAFKSVLSGAGFVKRTENISNRVGNIAVSAIKEMALLSMEIPGAISLSWGLPSFPTPKRIREVAKKALDEMDMAGKYAPTHGIAPLREAVAKTYKQEKGIDIDPNKNIIIHAGAIQALTCALATVGDPGDEIIMTDPGFASHIVQIELFGMKPVFWGLDEENNWALDPDSLESLITEKTKALIIVNPANPTGSVFSEEDLRKIADIVKKHNIMVISDEPYDFLVYDGKKHFSIAQVEEIKDNVIFIGSLSKKYAMSGWRLGYSVSEAGMRNEMLKVHDSTVICAPTISQIAAVEALNGPQDSVLEFHNELGERRELLYSRLSELDKMFSFKKTAGTYYAFPRIECEHEDSYEFAVRILKETKVVMVPGGAFGPNGEHHVRMTFCGTKDEINEAFDRMKKWQDENC